MNLSNPMKHALPSLAAALVALSSPAMAAGLSGNVTVTLTAPGGVTSDGGATVDATPVSLSDTVTVSSGSIEITAGHGTQIGARMRTSPTPITGTIPLYTATASEFIDFNGKSIYVRLLSGSVDALGVNTTGYLGLGGSHARFEVSGLNVPGEIITGLTYAIGDNFVDSGTTGLSPLPPASFIHLTSNTSLVFELDQLKFTDRELGSASNHAEFRLDLQTTPVPEPAALVLLTAGLTVAGLRLGTRRQARAAASRGL